MLFNAKEMIEVLVNDYYDNPTFYRFMPQSVFTLLESAYLKGFLTVEVPNEDFTKMIILKEFNDNPQLQ